MPLPNSLKIAGLLLLSIAGIIFLGSAHGSLLLLGIGTTLVVISLLSTKNVLGQLTA